jgi:hypothetical protein
MGVAMGSAIRVNEGVSPAVGLHRLSVFGVFKQTPFLEALFVGGCAAVAAPSQRQKLAGPRQLRASRSQRNAAPLFGCALLARL